MITMVRLVNIKMDGKIAEADFMPENSLEAGHIRVDLVTGNMIECIDAPGYGAPYRSYARRGLIRMAKEGDTSSEYVIMWY